MTTMNPGKKMVFVVDDEPDILELISINLQKSGYDVEKFPEARPMQKALEDRLPSLIILDLMLPDIDGVEVCKMLKKDPRYSQIPVIMVTAKGEELDIVLGLEIGADDYIPKPFSPRELTARVKAVLRRGALKDGSEEKPLAVSDRLMINPQKFEVLADGEKVYLTTTEFSILRILAEKPGWVFSREKLLDLLWGDSKDVFDRTVDVHIKNLRDKLGSVGTYIKNVRGVGYKLEV